ncbi:hypothetical protein [Halorussus salinus]|uniref:hypothetical protein n=1 Tax=Halorussus salinus TaxID=1364935 RepID=UPI001093055D|nr:hypothetical protein [Halorussus salinus]
MHRRELLGAVGTGAVGVAGLLGTGARGAGQETETAATTTAETTSEDGGFDGIESSADRPFATISVGTRANVVRSENNRPHAIRVWNDSDRARAIRLRLARGGGSGGSDESSESDKSSAALDRRVEFPADGYLTVRLLEPGDYALTVRPGDGTGEGGMGGVATTATATATAVGSTIEVPRSRFDCNDSRTDVRVASDGAVRSVTTATEIGCPPEEVGRTFTAFRGSCGSADDAGVSFTDGLVEVSGSIRVPNPCYGARLADVSIPDADTLRVTVAATDPSGGVCVQCVGSVEYAADLRFRDSVPRTVEVVHRRGGESAVVATATRGGSSGDVTTSE